MNVVSYSRKVFVPVTELCRDVCHYCTFAKSPRKLQSPYMSPEQVLAVAEAGKANDCKEVLFTLGDKPELRYKAARDALGELGFDSTLQYVEYLAQRVFAETGLLPHINAGVMSKDEMRRLKRVAVSQGLMLESAADRLCESGGPHFGSPDKLPVRRLENIRFAGELQIPFTSGILIGIGETRDERIQSLEALAELHGEYGHIQEIIIQNFRAKPDTKMASAPEPDLAELLWTIRSARQVFGDDMPIQTPPNLNHASIDQILAAGVDDWGGISPVTPDFVNPEAPWPHIDALAEQSRAAGKTLVERLAVYPKYLYPDSPFVDPQFLHAANQHIDSEGYVRSDNWCAGLAIDPPCTVPRITNVSRPQTHDPLSRTLWRARRGLPLTEQEIVQLFAVREADFDEVCAAADALRKDVNGDTVSMAARRSGNAGSASMPSSSSAARAGSRLRSHRSASTRPRAGLETSATNVVRSSIGTASPSRSTARSRPLESQLTPAGVASAKAARQGTSIDGSIAATRSASVAKAAWPPVGPAVASRTAAATASVTLSGGDAARVGQKPQAASRQSHTATVAPR